MVGFCCFEAAGQESGTCMPSICETGNPPAMKWRGLVPLAGSGPADQDQWQTPRAGFQYHLSVELRIGGLIHLAHAPLADEGGDVVVAESGADVQRHANCGYLCCVFLRKKSTTRGADGEGHSDRRLDARILCPSGESPAQNYLQNAHARILRGLSSLEGGQECLAGRMGSEGVRSLGAVQRVKRSHLPWASQIKERALRPAYPGSGNPSHE